MEPARVSLFFPVYRDEATDRAHDREGGEVPELGRRGVRDRRRRRRIPDRSGAIADALAQDNPCIRVIHHPENLGYGAAIRTGLAASRFEYICFTDGDDQYEIEDFRKLLRLREHYDLIITFRYRKIYSSTRIFVSWVHNTVLRFMFRTRFRDVSTGLRMVRRSLIDEIRLESNSPFIGAELAIKAMVAGYRVGERWDPDLPADVRPGLVDVDAQHHRHHGRHVAHVSEDVLRRVRFAAQSRATEVTGERLPSPVVLVVLRSPDPARSSGRSGGRVLFNRACTSSAA